jgi:hypothetical protein
MAQRKLTMRKTKEILRLKWELGLSARQVGASLNISHSTAGEYLKRAQQAGLDWEQAKAMSEAAIEKMLFPPQDSKTGRPEPNWPEVEKELKQKGVTRMLLWQEYLAEHPDGYSYSQFCERYRQWQNVSEKTSMRKPKKAGEEVEVDYAGLTVPVTDPETGESHDCRFLWGCWAPADTSIAKRIAAKACPTGCEPMCVCLSFLAGCPRSCGQTILKQG